MYKRLDLTQPEGMGFSQDTFAFMQESYRDAIAAIATVMGDLVILSGVEVSGGSVTPGWVVIGGELMPFTGGIAGPKVIINEAVAQEQFGDLILKDVYYTRTAQMGVTGGYDFSSFTRLSSIKDLTSAVFKPGMITMWSGAVDAIPAGFALCDGAGGRPDLRGRFIAGFDAADGDYDAIGKTGGEKRHTLTTAEMPEHSHSITASNRTSFGGFNSVPGVDPGPGTESGGNTNIAGGGQAHENRPPYYVLAYIIKL